MQMNVKCRGPFLTWLYWTHYIKHLLRKQPKNCRGIFTRMSHPSTLKRGDGGHHTVLRPQRLRMDINPQKSEFLSDSNVLLVKNYFVSFEGILLKIVCTINSWSAFDQVIFHGHYCSEYLPTCDPTLKMTWYGKHGKIYITFKNHVHFPTEQSFCWGCVYLWSRK